MILSISDILGSLVLFPSTCYIQWWLANGWRGPDLAILSVVFSPLLWQARLWSLTLSKKRSYLEVAPVVRIYDTMIMIYTYIYIYTYDHDIYNSNAQLAQILQAAINKEI